MNAKYGGPRRWNALNFAECMLSRIWDSDSCWISIEPPWTEYSLPCLMCRELTLWSHIDRGRDSLALKRIKSVKTSITQCKAEQSYYEEE